MKGIFVWSRAPLILEADSIEVNLDYSNQAFALIPFCNYPEANLNGEVIIWNSIFKGTKGKQIQFVNDFLSYSGPQNFTIENSYFQIYIQNRNARVLYIA